VGAFGHCECAARIRYPPADVAYVISSYKAAYWNLVLGTECPKRRRGFQ
jgi:hypothetical protein